MGRYTATIQTTSYYTIEIDTDNNIVKEYEDTDKLIQDIVSYRFDPTLPVIADKGVRVIEAKIHEDYSSEHPSDCVIEHD